MGDDYKTDLAQMFFSDEDSAYDQPCRFGWRADTHAVYCHNETWPNAPRKCRRTWYTGGKDRDEDCEGYQPNPRLNEAAIEPNL